MQDSISSILKSVRQFFSGTLFSRVTGLIRDIATAYAFGASASVAAFLVAFRFSHLLRRILGEGALQGAFTPRFEALRHHDPREAALFFRDLQKGLGLLLVGIVLLGMLGLFSINYFFELSQGNAEIVQLTILLMPGLLFICLYGLNAALLQCEKRYLLSSAAPALLNIGWTAGALWLASDSPSVAMPWLALCVVLAAAAQWGVTVPACLSIIKNLNPSGLWERWNFLRLKELLGPIWLSTVGIAASQVNVALDAVFARYADLEGPAFLWYAIRLQQLPLALFGIAIANAILPPLSRAAKRGDEVSFRKFMRAAWRGSLALMVPITIGIFLFGRWAIQLLYGHGDFDSYAGEMTQLCLEGYALGLIPMALVICHVQGCYARGDYRRPMVASLISVGTNSALSLFFIMEMGWGSPSIAVATSVSAWVNLGILCWKRTKSEAVASLIDMT